MRYCHVCMAVVTQLNFKVACTLRQIASASVEWRLVVTSVWDVVWTVHCGSAESYDHDLDWGIVRRSIANTQHNVQADWRLWDVVFRLATVFVFIAFCSGGIHQTTHLQLSSKCAKRINKCGLTCVFLFSYL